MMAVLENASVATDFDVVVAAVGIEAASAAAFVATAAVAAEAGL